MLLLYGKSAWAVDRLSILWLEEFTIMQEELDRQGMPTTSVFQYSKMQTKLNILLEQKKEFMFYAYRSTLLDIESGKKYI